ncbi:MAG: helix-turn-helix domain-containing protein [Polaribacter sp.]
MEISRELLFFFIALGAFNGLVLSFYFFFFAKQKHISNHFLGAFLLMISIRTGKSVFFFFNPYLSYHYLQFGLTACFFIGPFLYFYIKSTLKPESSIKTEWKYHFVILVIISLVLGFLYPFKTNVDLWRPYFIKTIYYSWLGYNLLAGYQLMPTLRKIFLNRTKVTSLEIWVLSIFFGNFIVWFAYTYSRFTSYIVGTLTFSFLFYLVLLFLFFNKKKRSILFNTNLKYADKKIDENKASTLIERLNFLMIDDKLYQNANLKSSEIAEKLGLTTHQFSQLLNDNLKKNFSTFVNEYRIDCAKQKITTISNITLEEIGYECGFNSKSTFYTTFKKLVGKTPAQFKSANL